MFSKRVHTFSLKKARNFSLDLFCSTKQNGFFRFRFNSLQFFPQIATYSDSIFHAAAIITDFISIFGKEKESHFATTTTNFSTKASDQYLNILLENNSPSRVFELIVLLFERVASSPSNLNYVQTSTSRVLVLVFVDCENQN